MVEKDENFKKSFCSGLKLCLTIILIQDFPKSVLWQSQIPVTIFYDSQLLHWKNFYHFLLRGNFLYVKTVNRSCRNSALLLHEFSKILYQNNCEIQMQGATKRFFRIFTFLNHFLNVFLSKANWASRRRRSWFFWIF